MSAVMSYLQDELICGKYISPSLHSLSQFIISYPRIISHNGIDNGYRYLDNDIIAIG
jgi:hypothetical protein